jgi:putative phosphoribosyl transferase
MSISRTDHQDGRGKYAELHELDEYRDKHQLFRDRFHAGEVLAGMLAPRYRSRPDALVLAIPSGGVPVGLEISRRLGLAFDTVIVRKLQIPGNTEAGFGAVGLSGRAYLNEGLLARLRLSPEQIEDQIVKVRAELQARDEAFRGGRPLPEITGRLVILCDDGIASGYTMLAAVGMMGELGAGRIAVAVPTAPLTSLRLASSFADEIWCANVHGSTPFAVANAYVRWHDLEREEVIGMLAQAAPQH